MADAEAKASRAWARWALPVLGVLLFRLTDWAFFGAPATPYGIDGKFLSRMVQIIALVAALVVDRRARLPRGLALGGLAAAAAASGLAAAAFAAAGGRAAMLASCALHGLFQATCVLAWGCYLCSVAPRRSALQLTGAFALFYLASWALGGLPAPALGAVAAVAPACSVACLRACAGQADRPLAHDGPLERGALREGPAGMLALLLLCTVSSTFVHTLVPTVEAQHTSAYCALCLAVHAAIFAAYLGWTLAPGHGDPRDLWPVFPVVVLGGLIGYTAFVNIDAGLATMLLTSTQTCVLLFCWVTAASVTYTLRLPRVFSFGLMNLVFTESITLVINLRAILTPQGTGAAGQMEAVAVTMGMALALIVACIVILCRDNTRRGQGGRAAGSEAPGAPGASGAPGAPEAAAPQGPARPGSLQAALDRVASGYRLTDRERDVALRLARGYTLPQTADALGLTLDTVRSHVKRLYAKLDIHKKQQLIELLEEEMASEGGEAYPQSSGGSSPRAVERADMR